MVLEKAASAVLIAISAACAVASPQAPRAPLPAAWHREPGAGSVPGAGTYSVALPSTMQKVPVTGVGSSVAEYRSRALTLLFDFGPHAVSAPSCRGGTRCSVGTLAVRGGRAHRIRDYVPDPDGDLPYRADYEIPFPAKASPRITLTIHAECATAAACRLADRIVKTIEIQSDR